MGLYSAKLAHLWENSIKKIWVKIDQFFQEMWTNLYPIIPKLKIVAYRWSEKMQYERFEEFIPHIEIGDLGKKDIFPLNTYLWGQPPPPIF